jgi:coenzyme F420 biosynthesis associated uncharacterized protein
MTADPQHRTAPDGSAPGGADSGGGGGSVDLLVDWDLAARTAARVAGAGPQIGPDAAAQVVGRLRQAAARSVPFVADTAQLTGAPLGEVLVVDRAGWARSNAGSFRRLLDPVVSKAFEAKGRPSAATAAVGSRVSGTQVGALLGFLAGRVLGQYDPFAAASGDATGGRLLLVAPNVVQVQRELEVDLDDFALWVCLHEETHRVQFTANPWLAAHLRRQMLDGIGDLLGGSDQLPQRFAAMSRAITDLLRSAASDAGSPRSQSHPDDGLPPLVAAVTTPEQRAQLARITAVMSLLEGHADVVMDDVGPTVVPTVSVIRERFTKRRAGRGPADRLLRRLLGLEAKMRQYADGAGFVRQVQAAVGLDGFNEVWTSAETLPLPAEIADPALWVRRVHG